MSEKGPLSYYSEHKGGWREKFADRFLLLLLLSLQSVALFGWHWQRLMEGEGP